MKRMVSLAAGVTKGLLVALLCSCSTAGTVAQPVVKTVVVPQNAEKVVAVQEFLSGKVVETMNATGYTYIQLEKDGQKAWFAVPSIEVNVGQMIEVLPGTQMGQFNSKSLRRSFESIVFSPGLVLDPSAQPPAATAPAVTEQNVVPPGHPPMSGGAQTGVGAATKEQLRKVGVLGISGKVVETMNSGGYTYVLIASGDKNIWGAVPTTEVSVGQEIELLPGQTMTNFSSKSLNKTFDSVIFSTGVVPIAQ
jgi:hypothetical protein